MSDAEHRKLEGIVTDRDLCCAVIAEAKLAEKTKVENVMTCNPVTCAPENTLDDCERLMQIHQVRRLPVVDAQGRCVGMIAQADIVLHAPVTKVAKTLAEISRATRVVHGVHTAIAQARASESAEPSAWNLGETGDAYDFRKSPSTRVLNTESG